MSEVLTEICKMDPTFDKELFIRDCRDDIIPNVLEAIVRGDLEILEDWCHEAVSDQIKSNTQYIVWSMGGKQKLNMCYTLFYLPASFQSYLNRYLTAKFKTMLFHFLAQSEHLSPNSNKHTQ